MSSTADWDGDVEALLFGFDDAVDDDRTQRLEGFPEDFADVDGFDFSAVTRGDPMFEPGEIEGVVVGQSAATVAAIAKLLSPWNVDTDDNDDDDDESRLADVVRLASHYNAAAQRGDQMIIAGVL